MQADTVEIRKIRKNELSLIRDFPPVDWNLDLEKVYKRHFDQDYFYPIVAVLDHEIAGTGIAVVNDNATWIGTIIVLDKYRKKGIGNAITNHLIDYSKSKGIGTIILAASDLGLPIYKKIGFEHDFNYLFFKADNLIESNTLNKSISGIAKPDYDRIFELDYAISGEKRKKLLIDSLKTGFKYKDNIIKGFYLPDFGKGLIIADSDNVGLELLKFRLSLDTSSICLPETNLTAIDYLNSIGFYQYLKTPRMFLNKNVNCDSKHIYSRGCGYLG
jgi:GNAT superfamily N-acetyltransferase